MANDVERGEPVRVPDIHQHHAGEAAHVRFGIRDRNAERLDHLLDLFGGHATAFRRRPLAEGGTLPMS
jgi:hypothetical protein